MAEKVSNAVLRITGIVDQCEDENNTSPSIPPADHQSVLDFLASGRCEVIDAGRRSV